MSLLTRRATMMTHGGVSPLPAGYEQVRNITNNGKAYINTGVESSDGLVVDDYSGFDDYGNNMSGADRNGGGDFRFKWGTNGERKIYLGLAFANNSVNIYPTIDSIIHFHIENENSYVEYQGEKVIEFSSSYILGGRAQYIHLYAMITDRSEIRALGKQKRESCAISENGVMIRNFVPAKRSSDNAYGLYDLCGSICEESGTPFYINANTEGYFYES